MEEARPRWQRSHACEDAACVEVCVNPGEVLVRSSTSPDGPVLRFTAAEWKAFLAGAVTGQFEPLS